jgi:hypothetical protein
MQKYILVQGEQASFSLIISFSLRTGILFSMVNLLVVAPLVITDPSMIIRSFGFKVILSGICQVRFERRGIPPPLVLMIELFGLEQSEH